MNKVTLIGNLTKDPEVKSTPSGKTVATTSIATNKSYKDQSGEKKTVTQFHNLVIWGKQAEVLAQYTKKGSKLAIIGELQTRNYQAQDGTKRYVTEVLVNEFEFLGSPQGNRPPDPTEPPPGVKDDFFEGAEVIKQEDQDEIKVENIPF